MQTLSRKHLLENENNQSNSLLTTNSEMHPVKVLQFGEGNFLRAFVDEMLDALNMNGLFNGSIAVVQPIREGMVSMLKEQDGLYTLLLRGLENGQTINKKRIVTSISDCINPFEDYEPYARYATLSSLRVIVSNTTEAGITYAKEDYTPGAMQNTFPAKITAFLYDRYQHFQGDETKTLIFIPCELIDYNGTMLKKYVLQYAEDWDLGPDFCAWVQKNHFTNTLVDRIVTGYPRDEVEAMTQELGYVDKQIVAGEIFHFWVIECEKGFDKEGLSRELPFCQLGLNVVWTDDAGPYKLRKVRILNGSHTMSVLAAYLAGKNTVGEMMKDEALNRYLRKGIFEEIIPTLDLPEEELLGFANSVFDRFSNPFIKHYLLSIALNSVSKFKVRVLPSILEFQKRKGSLPDVLSFSLAALLAFYKGTEIKDNGLIGTRDGEVFHIKDELSALERFAQVWTDYEAKPEDKKEEAVVQVTQTLLADTSLWDQDLNLVEGLTDKVSGYLKNILQAGVTEAIKGL